MKKDYVRLTIGMDNDLRQKIREAAAKRGLTMSAFILMELEKSLHNEIMPGSLKRP